MLFTRYVASDVSNENAYSVIRTEEDSCPHSHHFDNTKSRKTLSVSSKVYYYLLLVFGPWAGLGRDQSSVRRLVWLWYAASWASC